MAMPEATGHDEAETRLRTAIERALEAALAGLDPPGLAEAARHAVLGGGKRFRPLLCLFAARAVGGDPEAAMPAACAFELVHAYSLVHDDLPAMDDAPLRRGRPSCHAMFGEAEAILAGDALLTLAFGLLAGRPDKTGRPAELLAELARAAGHQGMVGGQWDDMKGNVDFESVARRKTGALIRGALVCGGLAGGGDTEQIAALGRLGDALGRLFQLTDDLLDAVGSADETGKQPGLDSARARRTSVSSLGVDGARREAARCAAEARAEAARLGDAGRPLAELVDKVERRRR